MITALALLCALGRPAAAAPAAQNARWNVNASTAEAELGVPYALAGTVTSDSPKDLAFVVSASTSESYAVADARFGKTILQNGERLQPFSAEILPLAVGKISVSLACAPAGAPATARFASPPILIDVAAPTLPQNAEPRDIKAPRSAGPPLWPWLVLAAVLATGYALYRAFSKKNAADPKNDRPVDSRPPEVIAESDLNALQKSGLWELGRHKDFYSALTDILKRYIERRFGFAAPRMTTVEIFRALRRADLDRGILGKLKEVSDRADLVKFAKIPPGADWGPSDVVSAIEIVRGTTPQPPEPSAPGQETRTAA
ncbi:MAG TPA: hypothetical protein VNK24_11405 [Elusimicrobiota bacterium]|nr:hypothetical protein [Elusimicrobiota bacterium]